MARGNAVLISPNSGIFSRSYHVVLSRDHCFDSGFFLASRQLRLRGDIKSTFVFLTGYR